MAAKHYKHLPTFFGGYFHQEWDLEGDDWSDVVSNYLKDVTPGEAVETAEELERFMMEFSSDKELADRLLNWFDCYYDPRPDIGGPTFRDWLGQVALALRGNTKSN